MPHKSQLYVARLAGAALCTASLSACRDQPQDAQRASDAAEMPQPPTVPILEAPFNRAQLLLEVVGAASAHSAGLADSGRQRPLDGKQFEVRLRFGCDGPGPGRDSHGWSLDPDGRTLRLRAVPNLSLSDDVAAKVAGESVEAVEGFWLPRPWLLEAACPAKQPAVVTSRSSGDSAQSPETPAKSTPSRQTVPQRVGIAQFFTVEDARTRRRMNRPFEAVRQLSEDESPGQNGFDLVLSGRLRARADGLVILCSGSGIDRPPDCIVSATVDRVRIERPDDKAILAEWGE